MLNNYLISVPVMASSSEENRFLDDLKRRPVKISLIDTQISGVIQRISQKKSVILEDGVKIIFVYLFDVLLLGGQAFKHSLSMILERTHDCRCIARCLRAEFRVDLTNVFDTQVADLMLFYSETGGFLPDRLRSLQEVLRLHLKLPASDLSPLCSTELQPRSETNPLWYLRPSPPALMNIMSASVSHLLPLRLVLLDALMSDYTILVDTYMSSYHNQSVHIEQKSAQTKQQQMDFFTGGSVIMDNGLNVF
uniref:Exonuclease 3'-5' domain containing 1 n=1 Tax=Sinocyclocheilus anshuiensis TaxID=1608454 RepID=A0A671QX50_9TELE